MTKQRALLIGVLLLLPIWGCKKELPSVNNPMTAYVTSHANGIYQTHNGGVSWFPLDIPQEPLQYRFKRILKDPLDENLLYVATAGNGLYQIDLKTSSIELIDAFKDQSVVSLTFCAFKPDSKPEMIVAVEGKGVYKRSASDLVWHEMNDNLNYRKVNIVYAAARQLFAGTIKELYKWDFLRNKWRPSSTGIVNANITAIASSPDGKVIFAGAGTYEGEKGFFERTPVLYKSNDNGETWLPSDRGIPQSIRINAIALNPQKRQRIYLGTSQGIFRSDNDGHSWHKVKDGAPEKSIILDLQIIPGNENTQAVYAVCGTKGVIMTLDNDRSMWIGLNYGIEPTTLTSLFIKGN